MTKRDFRKGDKVKVISDIYNTGTKEEIAIVVDPDYNNTHTSADHIGVAFSRKMGGHNCHNTCEDGYGCYMPISTLEKITVISIKDLAAEAELLTLADAEVTDIDEREFAKAEKEFKFTPIIKKMLDKSKERDKQFADECSNLHSKIAKEESTKDARKELESEYSYSKARKDKDEKLHMQVGDIVLKKGMKVRVSQIYSSEPWRGTEGIIDSIGDGSLVKIKTAQGNLYSFEASYLIPVDAPSEHRGAKYLPKVIRKKVVLADTTEVPFRMPNIREHSRIDRDTIKHLNNEKDGTADYLESIND